MHDFSKVVKIFVRTYSLELIDKYENGAYLLYGCRSGSDGLFSPRLNEEDDDQPDFNDHIIIDFFKKYGFKVDAWDHEKGLFSIGETL